MKEAKDRQNVATARSKEEHTYNWKPKKCTMRLFQKKIDGYSTKTYDDSVKEFIKNFSLKKEKKQQKLIHVWKIKLYLIWK